MENLCKKLMLGGSVAAMLAAVSAVADAQENNTESVTVSASRIQVQGYEAPTPVTVIGIQQLQRDAKVDIGDAIRELPSVGISDAPGNGSHSGNASQGDAGLDTVNLRNLGVVRTLVLFDRQRVVTSNPNASGPPAIGGVDLSTLPSNIIERVDVVTGGASAQWGSDAVAGVVNLVINKTFSGLKANIVYGNSQAQDQEKFKGEVSAGFDWFGGRAHTVLAGTYTMSPNAMFTWNRKWGSYGQALFPCSSLGRQGGTQTLCHTYGTGSAVQTNGGLIVASPASATGATVTNIRNIGGDFTAFGAGGTAAANQLRGLQFVGNGNNTQAVPFNFGIVAGSTCIQCSGYNAFGGGSNISNPPLTGVPFHNVTLFQYTSFKLTDSITASIQLNYGKNNEENQANNGRQGNTTFQVDNAFLPTAVRNQMIANGIPSLTVSVSGMGNLAPGNVTLKNYEQAVSQNFIYNNREMKRGVFTLDGALNLFGEDWSWEAYAQHSNVRETQYAPYNTYGQNYRNAIDAVVVQPTGPNSLGGGNATTAANVRSVLTSANVHVPQVGEIACRSSLTATSFGSFTNANGFQDIQPGGLMPGCVPLNSFGTGNASQAALNYVAPGRVDRSIQDQALYILNQAVFSASASGTLPFGLPAGKIALATGFEYRLEQERVRRDPLQFGAAGVYESGNFAQFAGAYNVQEGFLEVSVPLLRNNIVDSLDVDAAGRITSYSTSGLVETWKLGATSQVNEDIKLRTSLSSDIRAPGVGELFTNPLISTQTVTYPPGTGASFQVKFASPGNPNLVPEQSTTVSGGVVLTPHWIENLQLSFDWYSISIHKGIFSYANNTIFDQCANQRNPTFCSLVFFARGVSNGVALAEVDGNNVSPGLSSLVGPQTAQADGALNLYFVSPLNATSESVSGLDFQVDYHHDLFDGILSWHLVGNYTDSKTRTSLGATVNGAGAVSGDGAVNPLTGFTSPKLHALMSATYAMDPWSLTAQARVTGSAKLSNQYIEGVSPGTLPTGYLSYVDNNSVPAVVYGDFRASWRFSDRIQFYGAIDNAFNTPPPFIGTSGGGGVDCRIYDCIGRAYRVGIRFDD